MPKCPLCPAELNNIRQHLRTIHKVMNLEERDILIKLARGRVNLRDVRCPLCRGTFIYISNHLLNGHKDLTVSLAWYNDS